MSGFPITEPINESILVIEGSSCVPIAIKPPDDLATLTIRQLRELPEFTRIPDTVRRTLRKKDSYIEALVKVRNPETLRAAL